jgi:hypothetical protein
MTYDQYREADWNHAPQTRVSVYLSDGVHWRSEEQAPNRMVFSNHAYPWSYTSSMRRYQAITTISPRKCAFIHSCVDPSTFGIGFAIGNNIEATDVPFQSHPFNKF